MKTVKYVGRHLGKYLKGFTLKITEHLKKKYTMFMDQKTEQSSQFFSLDLYNQSNPNQNPSDIFVELYKPIPNYIFKWEGTGMYKTSLKKNGKNGSNLTSSFLQSIQSIVVIE